MVQFNKLRLTGFKSFVESTELSIQAGMTGIVGPNGCGKSNLVEALRWVMGETSAKRMRGGEMDDVIFGGSGNRPARNVAEVILTLDNADRRASSQFNESDDLEISRRIDRGEGSTYKVNGKEARARDVQLLFQDISAGAHSTALVSQGRVGAIVNAKPTDRRSLLEEAAGITGLHTRRHEAELRLKAAEANLARLDDVIITLESQLGQLKKQARQASRYRNLQDHIRRAEAILFHLQWQDARQRLDYSEKTLMAAETAVVSLTSAAAIAATRQTEAATILPSLRQAEAEAAAELQRLTIARGALDKEEERIAQARSDADRQLRENEADHGRELALTNDAVAAAARLSEERGIIEETAGEEAAISEETQRRVEAAQAEVDESEAELGRLTQDLAAAEARAQALIRRLDELQQRRQRLGLRAQEVDAERQRLSAEIANDAETQAARAAVAEAEAALEEAQAVLAEIEAQRGLAGEAESQARAQLQQAQDQRQRLKAEVDALSSIFANSDADMWPPLIDSLTVAPGYETALAAALGDDLQASTDLGAPTHWREGETDAGAPSLPGNAEPLSRFVTGSVALGRRLAQIGLVEDEATCRALGTQLKQGQRLVSKDGAMWRWDGFTIAAGTETAAATRLKQRNRLRELEGSLQIAEGALAEVEAQFGSARDEAQGLIDRERSQRQTLQAAYNSARQARDAAARVEQRATQMQSRLAAIAEQAEAVAGDIAELEGQLEAAATERAELPDLDQARHRINELRPEVAERRTRLVEARSALDRLQREAQQRQQRLLAIADELRSWENRSQRAQQHLNELVERRAHIEAEIERLSALPEEIAQQRRDLMDLLEVSEEKRRNAADALASAETALNEADRGLKGEEHKLIEAREQRVRAEAAIEQAKEAADTLTERIREKLECSPEEVLALAELDPGEGLPARDETEQRLAKLLRERENIGPVNLRAETESNELDQQLAGMQTERSDLINAISRLRQGIASLNREGRERLLAAFELVNGHFTSLFTRLFGGGKAHLQLTEAEDPLDAGLEIFASPPGKKLQILSLLSGGEQALTALALLFAVFLVNPAPICVLDEVDAPLDDANVERFCNLVQELAEASGTRFLVITHHRLTMARMDRLYGVTMAERGVSQLVSVDLQEIAHLKAAS
ncbi:chromosome segregation protein SMC [Dongia sp.]|uniref:chromosome segregation protein SMC n=1 Tax=Dongia sp. TaxID=1977262 RepID=UPI0035B337E0